MLGCWAALLDTSAYPFCTSQHFLVFLHLDRFEVTRYLFKSQCRDVCPEGFFHSSRRRCEPCAENCLMCSSEDHCLHCSQGHKLRNAQCVPMECSTGERCWQSLVRYKTLSYNLSWRQAWLLMSPSHSPPLCMLKICWMNLGRILLPLLLSTTVTELWLNVSDTTSGDI